MRRPGQHGSIALDGTNHLVTIRAHKVWIVITLHNLRCRGLVSTRNHR